MNYWFDMDGVIVKYEPSAYKGNDPPYLRKNAHYFASLTPDAKMIEVTKRLQTELAADDNIYILTSVSPLGELFAEQVKDKKNWLRTYAPHIDTDTSFFPSVSNKRDMAALLTCSVDTLSKYDILIDDYNKNLELWREYGGTAVKYLNGINSPHSWSGHKLMPDISADEIVKYLLDLK